MALLCWLHVHVYSLYKVCLVCLMTTRESHNHEWSWNVQSKASLRLFSNADRASFVYVQDEECTWYICIIGFTEYGGKLANLVIYHDHFKLFSIKTVSVSLTQSLTVQFSLLHVVDVYHVHAMAMIAFIPTAHWIWHCWLGIRTTRPSDKSTTDNSTSLTNYNKMTSTRGDTQYILVYVHVPAFWGVFSWNLVYRRVGFRY